MKYSNRQRSSRRSTVISLLLLCLWIGLGFGLRWFNLDLKPPSSIEVATIGYSLGHGFNQIPLDRVIDLDTLLAPLRLDTAINYSEVFNRLRTESTHPPLYFWLTRWWAQLWLKEGDLVSLQIARSLSVVFGTLAIPSIFALGRIAFRSRLVAHLAAILIAFSPYGIYLAQEARHYTLTILWVIISLICLVKALRSIRQQRAVAFWLSLVWIVVNGLGIATHYFFVLALVGEAIAMMIFWLFNRDLAPRRYLLSLSWAGMGTLATALVWLPMVQGVAENEMTTWISTSYELQDILLPIPRLVGWMMTMLMLLPVEGVSKTVAIASVLIVLGVLISVLPILVQQWRRAIASSPTRMAMIILLGYFIGTLMTFLVLIYGGGKDLSLAARYHFVYFPGLILLVAVALANCWLKPSLFHSSHKRVIILMVIMGLLGSLTVVNNLAFQKSRQSNALAEYIQKTATSPTLVVMTHQTHSEIRELVALAVSFESLDLPKTKTITPQFLLVSDNQYGRDQLKSNLQQIAPTPPKLLNLVGVNFEIDEHRLGKLKCNRDKQRNLADSGYSDRFYFCAVR